jgi:hypothetical protein
MLAVAIGMGAYGEPDDYIYPARGVRSARRGIQEGLLAGCKFCVIASLTAPSGCDLGLGVGGW